MIARSPVASSAQKTTCSWACGAPGCGPKTGPVAVLDTASPYASPSMRDVPRPLPNPYAAYLRVYEPLAAFPDGEREALGGLRRPRPPPGRTGWSSSTSGALAGVISVPPRPVPAEEPRDAFVLEVDGLAHVCPVQSRLRSWMALGAVPRRAARLGAARLRPAGRRWPGPTPTTPAGAAPRPGRRCGSSPPPGSVPVPWFVPFAPADQVDGEVAGRTSRRGAPDPDVGRPAPGRPGAAHAAAEPGRRSTIADELEELGRWLEEFHARSWLELDYAGLARLLGPEVVAADTSVADVAAAVAALAAGDEEGAVLTYRTVVDRWSAVAALEHAN